MNVYDIWILLLLEYAYLTAMKEQKTLNTKGCTIVRVNVLSIEKEKKKKKKAIIIILVYDPRYSW